MFRRLQPTPLILSAREWALNAGVLAKYNITRVDLKTFTFSIGSKSRCIDKAVLGPLPKRLLFTMIKYADFNGSVDTSPYKFRHYDVMEHEKTVVMGYRTLFEGSGIHNSNSGLQIKHMYINGYFMTLFDLTPDRGDSEDHTSIHHNGNIRIELQFRSHYPSRSHACCTSNMTVQS